MCYSLALPAAPAKVGGQAMKRLGLTFDPLSARPDKAQTPGGSGANKEEGQQAEQARGGNLPIRR